MAHVTSIYVIKRACPIYSCFDVFKNFFYIKIFLNSELFLPKGVLFVVSKYKQLVANRKRYNKIKTNI